ncbi:hypothetical protein FAZ95_07805 [Trinickia violacea]|uniref:DUF2384 domain-containing protein n=1 Tax=Trinickia violacea TaxID=2571746 RepID=A0A4P8IMC7_9BURK|nr:hypothetical protein [Trinickia violacea]QCP49091.1 hypothetical protein FAZ95_07805 [Trinickia violacea]
MSALTSPHRAAIDFRDELLRHHWPDDRRVAKYLKAPFGADTEVFLADARAAGLLLGVWSELQRGFVYPEFQFDRFGRLRPEVSQLLSALPKDGDDAGWRRAFWLYSPHALLGGLPPAELFVSDPERVFKAAQQEFAGDRDSIW